MKKVIWLLPVMALFLVGCAGKQVQPEAKIVIQKEIEKKLTTPKEIEHNLTATKTNIKHCAAVDLQSPATVCDQADQHLYIFLLS